MKTRLLVVMLLSAIVSTVIAQDGTRYSHTGPTMITGVRVIDGLGSDAIENQDIVLIDGKIASLGPAGTKQVPKDALVINGKDMTAMPGLIDMHVHLQGGWANGAIPGDRYQPKYDEKSAQQSLNAHLYAGVTTVLDCGSDHEYILKWRKRINDGTVLGPRFFTTGAPWDQTPSGWEAGNTTGDNTFGGSTKVTALGLLPEQLDKYKNDKFDDFNLVVLVLVHLCRDRRDGSHLRRTSERVVTGRIASLPAAGSLVPWGASRKEAGAQNCSIVDPLSPLENVLVVASAIENSCHTCIQMCIQTLLRGLVVVLGLVSVTWYGSVGPAALQMNVHVD